jgi:hypothetical protein
MFRFLFRFVGFLVLAGAFAALIYDGTKTIAGSEIYITKLGTTWNALHSNSLQLLQPAIERHVGEWLWDPVALNILTAPTWLVLGVLGAFLILIGRKKKPLIGYARN